MKTLILQPYDSVSDLQNKMLMPEAFFKYLKNCGLCFLNGPLIIGSYDHDLGGNIEDTQMN